MVFRLKQFAVSHAQSSMKIGTDAVLIGAWAQIDSAKTILDIGTGCGIIALICAQKNQSANITAIDIHDKSIEEAHLNFSNSPWQERMHAIQISIQEYSKERLLTFDHIISNPPFFTSGAGSPSTSRKDARHTSQLTPDSFFLNSSKLLSKSGIISTILPAHDFDIWLTAAKNCGLFVQRQTSVFPYPDKPIERYLTSFGFSETVFDSDSLNIRNHKGGPYSEAYRQLTCDYYL